MNIKENHIVQNTITKQEQLPLISVLMPIYNNQLYCYQAVKSILDQSYRHFELLIIDDCSTDRSLEIISKLNDSRIRIIKKNQNSGLSDSLNLGLQMALGKYIARMDGDDISHSRRLEKQISFLESNPDVVVCGTNYQLLGSTRHVVLPQFSEQIKSELLNSCCICHPSVLIRKSVFDISGLRYNKSLEPAEDYALWVALMDHGKFHNLQNVLFIYRVHQDQASRRKKIEQFDKSASVKLQFLIRRCATLSEAEICLLKIILSRKFKITTDDLEALSRIKYKLLCSNASGYFDRRIFHMFISNLENRALMGIFSKINRYTLLDLCRYARIRYSHNLRMKPTYLLRLVIKSLMFYKIKINRSEERYFNNLPRGL